MKNTRTLYTTYTLGYIIKFSMYLKSKSIL